MQFPASRTCLHVAICLDKTRRMHRSILRAMKIHSGKGPRARVSTNVRHNFSGKKTETTDPTIGPRVIHGAIDALFSTQ